MEKRVYLSSFPKQRYELIKQLPPTENCSIAKYKNKAQKINYLIYTHVIKSTLSERAKQKLITQIQQLSLYEQKGVNVVSKAYLQQYAQSLIISLRVRCRKAITLKQALQAQIYVCSPQQKIYNMMKMAQILMQMHKKGFPHGNISVSNINYKKNREKLYLGTPIYTQIHKFNQRKPAAQMQNQYPTLSGDIFDLGLAFLQSWLWITFPKSITHKQIAQHLSFIDNSKIVWVISRMLADVDERWSLRQVIQALKNWQNLTVPVKVQPTSLMKCELKLQIFDQISDMRVKSSQEFELTEEIIKKFDNSLLIFSFIEGRTYVNIVLKGKHEYLIDFSQQIQRWKAKNNLVWFNKNSLKQIMENPASIIRLAPSGCLLMKGYCKIPQSKPQPKKRQQIKFPQIQFPPPEGTLYKICTIFGCEIPRKGCVIAEWLLLTSAEKVKDLKGSQERLTFQIAEQNQIKAECDVWVASEETETLLSFENFCVISFNLNVTLRNFSYYLKMIKNYSQEKIQLKIKRQKLADYKIVYQFAGKKLQKGQIKFDNTRFLLKLPQQQSFSCVTGEPLFLKLPCGQSAVIGIYSSEGRGILFSEGFYWTLFNMIVKIRGESDVMNIYLPFIFIQCSEMELYEQSLPSINQIRMNNFRPSNHINKKMIEDSIHQLEMSGCPNELYLGVLNFLLFRQENSVSFQGVQMQLFYLRRATECVASHFKGKTNFLSAFIQYNLVERMQQVLLDVQQFTFLAISTVEMLRQGQYSPLLLMCANRLLRQVEGSPELSYELNYEYNLLCKNMGFIRIMRRLYQQTLEHSELIEGLNVQNVRSHLDQLQTYSFSMRQNFDFECGIKRAFKSIRNKEFNLINSRLDQLLARCKRKGSESLQQKLKEVWKSAITVFIADQCNLQQLSEFQALTKKYYQEEGYLSVREIFRKKEQLIRRSQQ